MSFNAEIQQLEQSAKVELFTLDISRIAPTLPIEQQILRFTAQTNELGEAVVWQGNSYLAYSIEATGFDISANGQPPRPSLKAMNLGGVLTDLCLAYDDLVGAKLLRQRTRARFLDAVNFANGNASADPNAHYPDELFYVERKVTEETVFIEWELRWCFDLSGVAIGRPIIQNTCPWLYKSAECSWIPSAGHYYDNTDTACAAGSDACSHSLTGCQLRFGAKAILPFGGFPAAGMVRR